MFHTFATDSGLVHNTTHTTGRKMAAIMIVFHTFHTLLLDIQDQQPRENLLSLFHDIPIDAMIGPVVLLHSGFPLT